MSNILIRDVDEQIVERIKRKAARRGQSMQQHLKRLVERDAGMSLLESYEAAERIAAQFRAEGRTFSDSTELVREDRDSR